MTATTRRSARTASALVLTGALVGSLVACTGPFGSDTCTPTVPDGESAALVTASGRFGSAPTVDFPTPLRSENPELAVIDAGDGDLVRSGQFVDFQVSLFNAIDGELITRSAYDPEEEPLRRAAGADGGLLSEALECGLVGSRFAVTGTLGDVFPPEQVESIEESLGLPIDTPVVLVFDLQAAYLGRATGTPQLGASGIPAVVTTPTGIPGVTIPNEEPPTELRAHTLVLGGGEAIEEGDRAVLHYTGLLWSTSTIFDSSWERDAPVTFTMASFDDDPNGVVPGLAQGLIGKTIGSQVIVVIPPELGYPEGQSPASIPAGSTMVFVVDILGVEG